MAGDDTDVYVPDEPSKTIRDLEHRTGRSDGCFQIDAKAPRGEATGWALHIHTTDKEVVLEDKPDALIKKVTLNLGVFGNGQLVIQRAENGWNVQRTDSGKEFFLRNGSSSLTPADYITKAEMETSDPTRRIAKGDNGAEKSVG